MSAELTRVDSAVAGLSISDDKAPANNEKEVKKDAKKHRRSSSKSDNIWNIKDLGKHSHQPFPWNIADGHQRNKRSNSPSPSKPRRPGGTLTPFPTSTPVHPRLTPRLRKLNTSPNTVEDKDILKLPLVNPPVKKIDLHFPLGLEVTARNLKGVTIKDALDAIYKQFKKKVSSPPSTFCRLY